NDDGGFVTSQEVTSGDPLREIIARNTPYLADLDGGGTDTVILDRAGNILFRKGLPDPNQPFLAPVTLNEDRPARDIALARTGAGWAVAAIDARPGPFYSVSLYTVDAAGVVRVREALTTTVLPMRLLAGDLTGPEADPAAPPVPVNPNFVGPLPGPQPL